MTFEELIKIGKKDIIDDYKSNYCLGKCFKIVQVSVYLYLAGDGDRINLFCENCARIAYKYKSSIRRLTPKEVFTLLSYY